MKNRTIRFLTRLALLLVLLLAPLMTGLAAAKPKHLLVVTVTKGFRHSSISTAEKVLGELAQKSGAFTVDYVRTDEDMAQKMTPDALKKYDGFIFANTTTQNPGTLPLPDIQAFLNEIKNGKAFIGMHSATDTFHAKDSVDPFIEMLGGEFKTHGAQVTVDCLNQDQKHPATKHLGAVFTIHDEIYQLKNYDPRTVHELLVLDKHPNDKTPGHYPISWCKMYGKGRIFYTSLGHREDVWDPEWTDKSGKRLNAREISEAYQKHIIGGIKWALGLEKGDAKPQTH